MPLLEDSVFFFFFGLFIWLPQVIVVGMRYFQSSLKHVASYFPDHGLNLGPLHWEHRVLATGPPGTSHVLAYFLGSTRFSLKKFLKSPWL